MTPSFLSAIVDTLIPGDEPAVHAPRTMAAPPKRMGEAGTSLPPASAVGVAVRLADHLAADPDYPHLAVLRAIASAAGGEEAFVRASEDARIAAVRRVEDKMRRPFAAFVSCVLQDYYEAEPVIVAVGWRAEPPQPEGHELPAFDDTLLEPVRGRRRMWR